MYCPKCRVEFRKGYRKCRECDVALVKELPPEPTPEYVDLKTVFVAPNQTVLMVVKSRLESEGIKCFTKNDYLQEILGMGRIGGLNIVGALELQVALKDVKKAKKILDITPPLKKAQAKSKAKPTARIPPKAKPKARAKKTPEVTRPLKKKKK